MTLFVSPHIPLVALFFLFTVGLVCAHWAKRE